MHSRGCRHWCSLPWPLESRTSVYSSSPKIELHSIVLSGESLNAPLACQSDCIQLHECPFRELGYFDGAPCRLGDPEMFRIDLIHRRKIPNILEIERHLEDHI